MNKIFIILSVFILLIFSSCKKDYVCMCGDPKIDTAGFIIKDTERNAKAKCESTKNPHNESGCSIYYGKSKCGNGR